MVRFAFQVCERKGACPRPAALSDAMRDMADTADSMRIFDRRLVRRHRDRAAAAWDAHDFLFRHVAEQLIDRLYDVKRTFHRALDLGCRGGEVSRLLPGTKGVAEVCAADLSPALAARARRGGVPAIAADEEALPFAASSFDLIVSNLSLHWVNDLPGALIQARRALKPDGLFMATMFGGETLRELRHAAMEAELAVSGGASPRLSPLTDVRDAGGLMQRAGFALPVVDVDTVTVTYETPWTLLQDLRGMGETNAALQRNPRVPPRRFWPAMAERYHALFAESDGRIPATFQILTLTGWAPDASQQQPMRPGSATASLAEALGDVERSAGDKVEKRS